MKGRATIDIVIIMLTSMVAGVVILSTIGIIIGRLVHPQADYSKGAEVIGTIVQTVVMALIGFIGGRATGKMEANGTLDKKPA